MNLFNKKIFFQTVYFLILKEFSIRYKGTFLGYLWTLLNPICFSIIYYIAFKLVMRFDIDNYLIVLLSAMFPWFWISTSLIQGTTSFRSNASLIKKTKFNYICMPLSNVIHDGMHFILSLPIILFLLSIYGYEFHITWLWQIPLMALVQSIFLFPLVLMLSSINVFLRDTEYIVSLVTSMVFFLTPIIYLESMVPDQFIVFQTMNPFNLLVSNWRNLFLNVFIVYKDILILLCIMIPFSFIARSYYLRSKGKFAEYL